MISVLVLDDHDLMRRGISRTIDTAHDMRVVAEAATGRQALARAAMLQPDVAILDMRLPDDDGASVCRAIRLRSPVTRCVIICSVDDDRSRVAAADAGAAAFLPKSATTVALREAVRTAAAGRTLATTLRPRGVVTARGDAVALTARERELLEFIADGLGNRQIAQRLGLAEKTVKNYVTSLLRKLGLTTRTQAAVYAVERRLS